MAANPQIVIAALKRGEAGFVHEAVRDADNAARVIIKSDPDAFVVGRIGPHQSVTKATKELRRLIMRELLVETTSAKKTRNRNRFRLLQVQGPAASEFVKAKNNHVVWIREGFNVNNLDALLDQLARQAPKRAPAVGPVRDTEQVSPGVARQRMLLEQEQWLTSEQVYQQLNGEATTNTSQMAAKLRRNRKLIGVQVRGVYVHPSVQIDESTGVVLPVIPKLLKILPATASDWEVVMWLFQPRHDLDGKRPADFLKRAPDRVLKAAQDDVAPTPESW